MLGLLRLLLEPFTLLHLLVGLGLARLWWKSTPPRRKLLLPTLPYLLLTVLSLPAVGYLALGTLEWPLAPGLQRPEDADAIVVLGAAVTGYDPVLGQSELNGAGLARTWHAYRLYAHGRPLPVVVSGGKPDPDDPAPPVAVVMAEELRRLGVPERDLVVESASRDTYENAVESCRLLRERGLTKVVVVSDAQHLPRALACFRKQGMDVTPSCARYQTLSWRPALADFVPSLRGLSASHDAAREWLLRAGYRLRGRSL